jgi:APA family basic amino acid/polyamine antiporter
MPVDAADSKRDRPHLVPVLGLFSATAIVVGEMIGSGIFMSPSQVARQVGPYVGLILALWLVCGLVNLCGALTLAELSAMFPQAGGTYVFLREAYGRMWSFLWCWTEFWVTRTGAIAILATYSGVNFEQALLAQGVPLAPEWRPLLQKGVAIGLIVLFAAVNMAGALWGGRVQNVFTTVKVGFVLLLVALPLLALRGGGIEISDVWPHRLDQPLIVHIGAALAAIMWAYDGWGNVTVIAEEVRQPEKAIPRALIGGVTLVTLLYFGANLAYHLTLPVGKIASEFIPAVAVGEKLMPAFGKPLILGMLMISMSGALNGNILVGPRVLFAVARDYRFLSYFSRLNQHTGVPVLATAAMSCWAITLILLGDLTREEHVPLSEVLINYCIFGGSIFYFSAVLAVFVLRARQPDKPRPYRTWGYPFVPFVFLSFYSFFLVNLFRSRPLESGVGLGFIALGLVLYAIFGRRGVNES